MDHVFLAGKGYVEIGELKIARPVAEKALCSPPPGTPNLTPHFLNPPTGGALIEFKWLANAQAWFRHPGGGHRLAFAADYLSQAGWTYSGPVT